MKTCGVDCGTVLCWQRFGPLSLAVPADPSHLVSANASLQRGADGSHVGRFEQIDAHICL